jgi:hypothetical protein
MPDGHGDDTNTPRVQFLYFAACPHAARALVLLRETLHAEGLTSEIEMIAVETDAAARQYNFYGSPTIRIDGDDVYPPDRSAAPSLACRLYPQSDGRFAPHPPVERLVHMLRRARRHNVEET